MPIELNDLESKRFGVIAARVAKPSAPLEDIDRAADKSGVEMLTIRIDASDLPRVHALEESGYRLMDTLVYYRRSLDRCPNAFVPRVDTTLRLATAQDGAAVAQVARAAFSDYVGHYHADPRIDKASADAAYVEWAAQSIVRNTGDTPVLVAEQDQEKIIGFLSLRRNNETEFEIVLNAVHPDNHGNGLYTALVTEAVRVASKSGASLIVVSTQINNYAVQSVWTRLGFVHYRSLYTFHKWYSRQPSRHHALD